MLKFFRQIRHKMLSENRTSKYLLYAAGEILLVVIGILIALQINNWSESQKKDTQIKKTVLEIKANLKRDSSSITFALEQKKEDLAAQHRVIQHLEKGMPFNDQLSKDLGRVMLLRDAHLVQNGYDILKGIGLEQINNAPLMSHLLMYYDKNSFMMRQAMDYDKEEFINVLLPYLRKNFDDWQKDKYGIPANYEQFRKDKYFVNSLKLALNNLMGTIQEYELGLLEIRTLILLIDDYLENAPK